MRLVYLLLANCIWLLHFFVVFIALFGWVFPKLWPLYIATLLSVLMSNLLYNYCVLSKWEYDLRKKINPETEYDFSYASYYTYRLTQGRLSPTFLRSTGILFVSLSLGIWCYFTFIF